VFKAYIIAGSSPRVRGTRAARVITQCHRRFIPAGAGNTILAKRKIPRATVHPRGCGEHLTLAVVNVNLDGSSPRVRGTHQRRNQRFSKIRFIPAGAGNTELYGYTHMVVPVHPRGCGEHFRG